MNKNRLGVFGKVFENCLKTLIDLKKLESNDCGVFHKREQISGDKIWYQKEKPKKTKLRAI